MTQSENKTALKIKYPDFSIDSEIDENLAKELQTITYDKLTTSSTTRTIKNIKKNIIATLKSNYPFVNGRVKEVADIILKKHGLHEDSFDFVNLFESGLHENINDISIDDNANKNEKVFRGYLNELEKSVDKLIGYDVLYRTMKDLYGEKEAKKLTGEMYTYALGLSDSSNVILPYCWALDASKLVTVGREFGVLKSKPAKRVSSYISMLCETIHQMSNHLAGAIAIGSFFLDLAHLMIYKERRTLNELRTDKRIRKMIENEVQQFIHSINHLSRNGAESPFTNVSIFDRPKLEGLISDDNYGWYFPNHKAISTDNDLQDKMSNEDFKKYVIDYITEIQNLFMDFFEKGDPLQNGMPYRFPVATINFSKVKNESTGKFEIQDKEFLKAVCKRDISRFNIFSSAGTKICSCCRLINDIEMLDFASQSNSLGGGGSISLGSHRVITINFQRIALECQSFEDYLNILSFRVEEAAKILKAHKLMLLKFTKEGYEPFIANGFINPKRLFSTFGLLGIYEANKTLRQKFDIPEDRDITGEILDYFNTKVNEVSKQYGIIGNIEQIPGESFAVRLAEADKAIYGFGDDYYKLYANQFCPLYEDFTLAEKIKTDGKYNMKLTGGGIVHIQIATQTTPQQNEQLIKFACAEGCEHFALNRVYSRCKKCSKVYNTKVDKCDCGAEGDDLERLTRVIGFFTPVSSWGKVRREWEFPRRRFTDVSENQMK